MAQPYSIKTCLTSPSIENSNHLIHHYIFLYDNSFCGKNMLSKVLVKRARGESVNHGEIVGKFNYLLEARRLEV